MRTARQLQDHVLAPKVVPVEPEPSGVPRKPDADPRGYLITPAS